jgi:hypothetical protein
VGWESSGLRRVACEGCANSMLQFYLERGGDGTKRCRKMKPRQRARLGSMGRKCGTVRWRDNASRRRGDTKGEKGGDDASWADANLTRPKNK